MYMQFQKKRWKQIVSDVKIKITQEAGNKNQGELKKLLEDFKKLKQRMLNRGII